MSNFFRVKVEPNISAFIKANLTDTIEYEDIVRQRNITLNLYGLMIGLGTILTFARVYFNFFFSIKASKNIHKAMVSSVLNSMMTFFDSHYIGNIVNRFSKDLNNIDEVVPLVIYEVFRVSILTRKQKNGHYTQFHLFLEHLPIHRYCILDNVC